MHIPFGFSKVGDVENFEWELADPWKKTDKTPEGKFFTIIYENVRIKKQRADKKDKSVESFPSGLFWLELYWKKSWVGVLRMRSIHNFAVSLNKIL